MACQRDEYCSARMCSLLARTGNSSFLFLSKAQNGTYSFGQNVSIRFSSGSMQGYSEEKFSTQFYRSVDMKPALSVRRTKKAGL